MQSTTLPPTYLRRQLLKGECRMANAHLDNLAARHARLDASLTAELKRPLPDAALLRRLKREKLKLKDALNREQAH
jgi:hypothetical protein